LKNLDLLRLLTIFLVAFSLASLGGPLSSNFHLPSIQPAHAVPQICQTTGSSGACSEYWIPAGPAMDTEQALIFTDESSEFTNIQSGSPSIDFTDWPLTPDLIGPFTTSPNFRITSSISQAGNFEVQFMLASNFWGVSMNFGNSTAGVNVRQGIWHMIDTAKFAADDPSLSGQAIALDSPNPSDNVGGLAPVNPCNWDSLFPETFSNCSNPPAGGLAYHLGTAAGAGGFVWNQAPGSADMNAAAAHFVAAGVATGCDGGTGTASCISSTDSKLSGISSAALSNPVNFFIRNDNTPRLDLSDSMAEQICYLFTGSYTVPCGYLTVTSGPITAFPGFTTSLTTVNLSWGMYTAAYGSNTGPLPFDSSFYFTYNSQFVSGISSIKSPTGPCSAKSVPTVSAADYVYLCDPVYDSLTTQMEFAASLSSSVSFGEQAENRFGAHAYTMEVFEQNAQFGYLNGWNRVINNAGAGLPNYFTWLDALNPSPAIPGTIRQGFKQTTTSINPYVASTVWDFYIISNIYDSLTTLNPLSGSQLIYWMTLSASQLPNSGLLYTPPPGTTQSFRFTLRSDMFWQDGRRVTPWDVKFTFLTLQATGAFQGGVLAPVTGVTVLSPEQFDVNVSAVGPFTLSTLTSVTILPGHYWSTCSGSVWDGYVGVNNVPSTCMNADPNKTSANFDPLGSGILVGSGPWMCKSPTGTLGTGCSSSGTMNPPVSGSYVLSRFGKGLAPGSSISSIYFRSNGNLALYLWSQNTGDGTKDFLNFSVVAGCFGAGITSVAPCAHFQRGIGANGGPVSVGLSQVAIVNRFVGLNWVAPFNWATSPPTGIIPLNPVLYENTVTLNPASVAGCTTAYPTGGYDC